MSQKAKLFLIGSVGTFAVFLFFYVRHPDPVLEHLRAYKALGAVLGTLSIVGLALLGGAWSRWNDARSAKQAFNLGLGLPALLLAADVAGISAAGASKATFFPITGLAAEGNFARVVLESVRLTLAPVSAVVRSKVRGEWRALAPTARQRLEPEPRATAETVSPDLDAELRATAEHVGKASSALEVAQQALSRVAYDRDVHGRFSADIAEISTQLRSAQYEVAAATKRLLYPALDRLPPVSPPRQGAGTAR